MYLSRSCSQLHWAILLLFLGQVSFAFQATNSNQKAFATKDSNPGEAYLASDLSNLHELWEALKIEYYSDTISCIMSNSCEDDKPEKNTLYSDLSSSSDDEPHQSDLNEDSSNENNLSDDEIYDNLELVQVFVYSRHGASTDSAFLYKGEYEPYHIKQDWSDLEHITALGKAQCWALGRHLAVYYPDFVTDSIESQSILFNTINLTKNKICTHFFWYGILNYTPNIGHFENQIVKKAIKRKGNCHNCTLSSQFPYAKSQMLSEGTENLEMDSEIMKFHPREFLDLDDSCKSKKMFLNLTVENLPKKDVQIISRMSPAFRLSNSDASDFNTFNAIMFLAKHLYHNLPMEYGLQNISPIYVKRALMFRDGLTEGYLKSYLDVKESSWTIPALYARTLIKDLKNNLLSFENMLNIYVIHNNNLANLIIFLLGARNKLRYYISWFASSVNLLVWKNKTTGEKYIEFRLDEELVNMRTCESFCEYEDFISLLEAYEELGGDLKEWCDA